jgi:hypothetical protein
MLTQPKRSTSNLVRVLKHAKVRRPEGSKERGARPVVRASRRRLRQHVRRRPGGAFWRGCASVQEKERPRAFRVLSFEKTMEVFAKLS